MRRKFFQVKKHKGVTHVNRPQGSRVPIKNPGIMEKMKFKFLAGLAMHNFQTVGISLAPHQNSKSHWKKEK